VNIAGTCGRCHSEVRKLMWKAHMGKPFRGKCRFADLYKLSWDHHIYAAQDPRSAVSRANVAEKVCANCHNSVRLSQKYGIASDRFASFVDSYHGLASKGGSLAVANCASCHGVHNIKPSSDQRRPLILRIWFTPAASVIRAQIKILPKAPFMCLRWMKLISELSIGSERFTLC